MTAITIQGNVGADPELRFTASGDGVASFSVAVTERIRNDAGDWEDGDTTWYRVTAWRKLGENVAESIRQGDRVIVTGRLKADNWEDRDGNARTSLDVQANDVGKSVLWSPLEAVPTTPASSTGYAPDEEPF